MVRSTQKMAKPVAAHAAAIPIPRSTSVRSLPVLAEGSGYTDTCARVRFATAT